MRLLLEILVIAVLVFLGWRQPLRDQVRHTFPNLDLAPSRLSLVNRDAQHVQAAARNGARTQAAPAPAPPKNGRWMWEPGSLDPKPK